MCRDLGVTNTWTGKVRKFQTWKSMVEWIMSEVDEGVDPYDLLPFCNNWNLDRWDGKESATEYRARLIDMAIGLQLI